MGIVVDESWTKLPVSELVANGVVAVSLYVSPDPSKNMNPQYVHDLGAAGIRTITNFEYGTNDIAGGYSGGVANAKMAHAQSAPCGMPLWAPVFFSVDESVSPSLAVPYFEGAGAVLGVPRTGVYGDFSVVRYLITGHYARWAWQTPAWSGGQVDLGQIQLLQTLRQIGGVADVDLIEGDISRIAWLPGEADPAASVTYSEVPVSIKCPELSQSMTGVGPWWTELMQSLLNVHGGTLHLTVDGSFGPSTLARLQGFQANNGLQSDGVCGPLTWGKLLS